jgi:hypothetical protein
MYSSLNLKQQPINKKYMYSSLNVKQQQPINKKYMYSSLNVKREQYMYF